MRRPNHFASYLAPFFMTMLGSEGPPLLRGFGHYYVRRQLGEGGCGQVFEAWDAHLCRSVALKRLKPAGRTSGGLLREARLAATLKHPAFVQVYAVEDDPAAETIIMEFVPGATLAQTLSERAMTRADALAILLQLAEAMHVAHGCGLAHGDLKPSNLMLEPSGRVRILDFGLARTHDPLETQSIAYGEVQGTLAYMAPERLQGRAADAASDIYALGVILYEMLAGRRPNGDLSGAALAAAQLQSSSSAWDYADDWDPALIALIRAMTASRLQQRLRSMQQVRERVVALQMGAPDAAASASAGVMRWRYWAPLLAAGGVVLLWCWGSLPFGVLRPYSEAAAMQAGMAALLAPHGPNGLDRATKHFNQILRYSPEHAGAAAGLSLAYSMHYFGDRNDASLLQRADASAQVALRQNDQLSLGYAAQAWVRDSQGRLEEAVQLARQALRLEPDSQFGLRVMVDLLIRQRRFDEAERVLVGAMQRYPADPWFLDCLGKMRFQQERYGEAEQNFRASLHLDPDSAFGYVNLSQALLRQDRGDAALQVLQQGLLVRSDGRLYGALGTVLFERGDYAGSVQAFQRALDASTGNPNLYLNWANLADALRWMPGRDEDARIAYRHAAKLLAPLLQRAPGDSTLQSRMGLYRAKLGERASAEHWASSALHAAPASAQVQFRAAITFELLGLRSAALAALARARRMGFPANLIESEPDLRLLRRDVRYHDLHYESEL